MNERYNPADGIISPTDTERITAVYLAGIEEGRRQTLGLQSRLSSTPTRGFRGWWDRITGRAAAREQGRNEAMLHLLEERDQAQAEGFESGQRTGVRIVAVTAAHLVNNAVSPVVGFAELLTLEEVIQKHPKLLAFAKAIQTGANDVAEITAKLAHIQRLVIDRSNPQHPILNLVESIKPENGKT